MSRELTDPVIGWAGGIVCPGIVCPGFVFDSGVLINEFDIEIVKGEGIELATEKVPWVVFDGEAGSSGTPTGVGSGEIYKGGAAPGNIGDFNFEGFEIDVTGELSDDFGSDLGKQEQGRSEDDDEAQQ